MSFSETLKDLMEDGRVSQQELAKNIGYSQRAVSRWVNGQSEPTESAIRKCALYFGVSSDYLLGLTDKK